MDRTQLEKRFAELYGPGKTRVFIGPARINLIGEHIDYSGGLVFPAAIDLRSVLMVRVRGDKKLRLASTSWPDTVEADADDLFGMNRLLWGSYQLGVIHLMQNDGFDIPGMDMLFDETVPHGGGLSASAAIELATATACAAFSHERKGTPVDMLQLAKLGRRVENEYIGMNCGIMDQFASAMGRKDCAMLIDCSTLSCEYAPVELSAHGLTAVIMNTCKPHELVKSEYNTRLIECREALSQIQPAIPVSCLCELSPEEFDSVKEVIGREVCRRRAEHAVYENIRTREAFDALNVGDMGRFGELLVKSHISLRDLYEVTGEELDCIVNAALREKDCIGARMMGGGFGGCAIALVKTRSADRLKADVKREYTEKTGLTPEFYSVRISDGAHEAAEDELI